MSQTPPTLEPPPQVVATESTPTWTPWAIATVALMTVGYAGYYLCRSDLSVARPLIIDHFKPVVTKVTIGAFTAVATALYALGKFIFGSAADALGGRRTFLLGMAGAIVFTVLFGIGGPPLFLLAWCGNRFIQSSGWVGMVKITSRWFAFSTYGGVMGLISLSFLFGDFLSRVFLGYLIDRGWGWQSIFYVSAVVLAVILVPTFLFLKNSPGEVGLPEPPADPVSVFATREAQQRTGLAALIVPLLTSRPFLVACVLSFGFTFMRETFNDWTPTFLHEVAKMSEGDAATASSLFPLFGGISVLGVGFLSDRWGKAGRALIIAVGLALSTLGLLALALFHFHGNTTLYVGVVALIAFVMIGPYSFLAGAVSLDFGGKKASATAAGWIDGVGYIGGILSGYLIAQVAESAGWQAAFVVLAVTAFLSFVFALLYWRMELANVVA